MTPEQEKKWREEYLEICSLFKEFKCSEQHWAFYLAACKKRIEETEENWNKFIIANKEASRNASLAMEHSKEIFQLKEELKREQACVDFYAKEVNWQTEKVNHDQGNPIYRYNLSIGTNDMTVDGIIAYGGKRARETQAQRKAL